MITIKDIAAESGYSITTVSRVLNHKGEVSPIAREKIEGIIRKYNFVPNDNAKNLKQISNKTIGIIVKGVESNLFVNMIKFYQQLVADTDYSLFVKYTDARADEVAEALQVINERKVIGLMLLGGIPEHIRNGFDRIRIPTVLVTNPGEEYGFDNLSSVCCDDVDGSYQSFKRLAEMGHKHIGIIGSDPQYSHTTELRTKGCEKAVTEMGYAWLPHYYLENGNYTLEGAYEATLRMIENNPYVTALFCYSDIMAIGAIRALSDKGIKVPEDMSVVGYDGSPISRYMTPRVSTVYQDVPMMAERSFLILKDMLENGSAATHEILPISLRPGESVRDLSK